MSTSSVRTAQILQFPVGGRKALAERKPAAPVSDLEAQAAAISVGDAWYHQAAIEDSKRVGGR
jgi:hypothetical protein